MPERFDDLEPMPSDVLVPLDNRYLFAAGLSF